jgi:nucleoside-diphosphate-sugar epimerase
LAAEQALLAMASEPGSNGRLPLTIVRPTAVFGPRDRDFFSYFDLVKRGLELRLGREERRVSLIYVRDLAELIVLALENQVAVGQTYFACGPGHTYAEFSGAIARALNKRTVRITLPVAVLTPIGAAAQVQEWLTHRPALLNKQRIKDMREPYWLCSEEKARQELGFMPRYDLDTAVRETVDWYQENGWL